MSKRVKTALRLTLMAIVGLVVGLNIYLWNAQSLLGNTMPMPFGFGASLVLTGSMEPTIEQDSLIFVREQDHYEVGQIVVYQSGSILVVHRIESIDGETVTTKGDANNTADAPVSLSAVKGEVIGHIPGCGPAVRAIKSPIGTVLLVAFALFLPELSFRREKKQDEDELEKIKEEIRRLKAEQE